MMLEERLHRDLGTLEDWACIAHSLGLGDLQPEQRDALWARLGTIFRLYCAPNDDFRVANVTRALKRLEQDVERLRNDLSFYWPDKDDGWFAIYETAASDEEIEERYKAISSNRIAWYEARAPMKISDDRNTWKDNEAFACSVDKLLPEGQRVAVVATLNKLMADINVYRQQLGNDKGGKLRDWRLEGAINALALVYYDHTRKWPGVSRNDRGVPGGPFLRFVKAVFQVFAPARLMGDEALVKLIRAGKKRKWGMRL
jgi:hypothetical protein